MALFDRSEYLARLDKTKRRMAAAGIDVLLTVDPANMNYLAGYDGWSFYVHQVLIVATQQEEPVWIGRGQDANGAKVTTFLDHKNILGYPDDYVQSTVKHTMDFVADHLKSRGWDKGTIGVEMDGYYFTAAANDSLRRNLPNARFKDATSLVNWVRVVKSETELTYMRQAAVIMERVMERALDGIVPGKRQCDLVAEILDAQARGTPEHGGDYASIVPMLPTGKGSSAPHITWSDEKFKTGEMTIFELAAVRHRYHCPLARTVYLGKVPQKMADAAKVVTEGLTAALAAAKVGARARDVEAAWRETIAKSGIKKDSRIGYSIGVAYPPDWGEHTVSLRPIDETVLQANMTIHCIPGVWFDDWGIEISEPFIVTPSGGQPFCKVPRQLFVKA
jgi:ectoine utilization protein EutD